MRNPLTKRIPREIKNDLGKYIALFLFLILSIGFISGFLVAGDSMKSAFDNSFEKYNVEDGHFCLAAEIDDKTFTYDYGSHRDTHSAHSLHRRRICPLFCLLPYGQPQKQSRQQQLMQQ